MKKFVKLTAFVLMFVMMFTMTAFAAGWTSGQGENSRRWWYDLGAGNYYAGTQEAPNWQWLDGNQDGVAECYAFDSEGWMYADTRTPDGYQVNEDGAWTENGVVQTRSEALPSSTAEGSHILIAYFSRTNNTERAANLIHGQIGGDIFEIRPAEAYPDSYSATTARAEREISAGALPQMMENVENFQQYDTIFVGYPIWWDTTPPVVNTFLDSNDFTGKTVIPFCTSGGSGIQGSLANINRYCQGANILSGRDLSGSSSDSVHSWLTSIGLIQ